MPAVRHLSFVLCLLEIIRRVVGGLYRRAKFCWNRQCSFEDICDFQNYASLARKFLFIPLLWCFGGKNVANGNRFAATFNSRRPMVVSHMHAKNQGQGSFRSKHRITTNGRIQPKTLSLPLTPSRRSRKTSLLSETNAGIIKFTHSALAATQEITVRMEEHKAPATATEH